MECVTNDVLGASAPSRPAAITARLFLISIALAALTACNGSADSPGSSATPLAGSAAPTAAETPADESFSNIGLRINEVLAGDLSTERSHGGKHPPWIELYNSSEKQISLQGFSLTRRGVENKSWEFPDVDISSGEYLRIWDDNHVKTGHSALQTDFSFLRSQTLSLVHRDHSILDRVSDIAFPDHQSWGRYPDGSDSSRFYDTPSPGRTNPDSADRFSLNCDYLTLSAGSSVTLQTTPDTEVSWHSNNELVQVSAQGMITTQASGAAGESEPAIISATDSTGNSRQCQVTVANWNSNLSTLTVLGHPNSDFLLNYADGGIYFTVPGELHKAEDGFENAKRVGNFPPTPSSPVMLKTPYGYFASSGKSIYSSQDFQHWTNELAMSHINLQHGFASYFDQASLSNYLYAGEYSVEADKQHAVYRGRSTGSNTNWESVLHWGPEQQFYQDNSQLDTIRHVHAVVTDPYTGHVYVATGDVDQHSRLYFSDDNGEHFKLLAMGSQKYRSLSIWFTGKYVYWNMDSERADQHVYRLPRSVYKREGSWPALTPELASGTTTVGVRYLVSATQGSTFPAAAGNYFYETQARPLSAAERVYPIEDPQYDYSESVADLTHASQWYHLWVKDQNGEDVLLMSTSAEGTEPDLRDHNSRVFGFKERPDGSVDVQELLNMPSRTPGLPNRFTQLIPSLQDGDGYIYFRGRETAHRTYKTRLTWVNAD